MANKDITIKRKTSSGTDTLYPTTTWGQITSDSIPDDFNPSPHTHGNINDDGEISDNQAIASGDRLVISDSSDNNKLTNSAISFGTSTSTFLRNDGTWGTVASSFDGGTVTSNITISNSAPRLILTDTNNDSDFHIQNHNGIFTVGDTTNQEDRFEIDSSGNVEVLSGDLTVSGSGNFKFKGSGGYYLYNSSGTFRGGIIDDGGATKIYADGNGSIPIITLDGGNIKTGGNLIFDDDANNSDYLIDFQEHPDGTYGAYIRYDGSSSNALEIGTRNAGTETESIFIDRNTADVTFRQDVSVQGNLGIQSAFPRIYLIDSDDNPDYSIFNGNGAFAIYDDTNSQYRLRFNSVGNAVFGNSSPSNLGFLERSLEIQAGSSSDTTLKQAGLVISGSSDSDDADDFAYLSFRNNHSTLSNDRVAELRVVKNGTNVDTADMKFYTANGTSLAARMTLTNDGKLGIGTELPSSTLEVVGDIRANRMYDRTNTSYYVDPASTSILYNIDVQNITTTRGDLILDANNNAEKLYISRYGSTSSEFTSISRGDLITEFHTKNDEETSTIRFKFENTDTETGGGADANNRNIDLISDANNARILIDGNKVATESYVTTQIDALVDSAPGALNTLNELATALGNDASFSTTMTNSLAGKLNLTGGTLTGTLTSRAINMQNYNLSNVGAMSFNDPGPNEGISWSGGNFKIYESPNDLSTNSAGNLQFVSGGARRLTVQTDGTVYVPGTLKAEKVEIEGALFDVETNSLRMPLVKGGHYNSDNSSETGAISITLPSGTYANATMMNFFVDVFDYAGGSDGESFTLHIGGYNYTDGTWHNVFANLVSGRTDRFFTVRFNYDSTNSANIIYIAETTSSWAYPKVTVRDFSAGFSGADDADWYNNSFTVSITSTMFGTTSRSKTAENVASNSLQLGGVNASSYLRSDADDTMSGTLTIDTGSSSDDALVIKGTSPTITFSDDSTGTDSNDDFYIHINGNNFYVLADRDGNGNVGTGYETPHPLQLEADTNTAYAFGSKIITDTGSTQNFNGDINMGANTIDFNANSGNSTTAQIIGDRSATDLDTRNFTTEGGFSYTTFDGSTSNKPSGSFNNANGLITMNTHSGAYNWQLAFANNQGKMFSRYRNGGGYSSWNEILTSASTIDADTLSGYSPQESASANSIAKRDGNGDLRVRDIRADGAVYANFDQGNVDAYVYFGDTGSQINHWLRFDTSAQQFGISNRLVGTAGRLGAIEYNGSDVDKVNFALSGSTLTITTS